jgi:hypothetical protein
MSCTTEVADPGQSLVKKPPDEFGADVPAKKLRST